MHNSVRDLQTQRVVWDSSPAANSCSCASAQGQFAFAAYDADRKQVFAARDPSGKEPLFYSFGEDGGVSFANNVLSVPGLEETWHALLPGAQLSLLSALALDA